jgi:hypothetical protein
MGRVLPIGMITGIPASIDNKFVAGSGVGAVSRSVRRAKIRAAAPKNASNCNCILDKNWKMAL